MSVRIRSGHRVITSVKGSGQNPAAEPRRKGLGAEIGECRGRARTHLTCHGGIRRHMTHLVGN